MAAQGACSRQLAMDAQCVLDHVWPGEQVHVAGPSMGGFIAQHLACLLLQKQRLLSLYLMVTSLGFQPRLRFPFFAFNAATSFILRGQHRHASVSLNPCSDLSIICKAIVNGSFRSPLEVAGSSLAVPWLVLVNLSDPLTLVPPCLCNFCAVGWPGTLPWA